MAEIGDIKYIPPSIPTPPARPVDKSSDQRKQQQPKQRQQPDSSPDDDDNNDGSIHIDEYV